MALTETLRPDAPAAAAAAPMLAPAAFLSGTPDARLADLLAFALAAEAGDTAERSDVAQRREQAHGLLTDHAFKLLHNRVEEIRREAVAEQAATLRRPPGLLALVSANLLAIGIAVALAAVWLAAFGPGELARHLARPG